jgi:hypothetical protein
MLQYIIPKKSLEERKQKNIQYSREYIQNELTLTWWIKNRVQEIVFRRTLVPSVFQEELRNYRARHIIKETEHSVDSIISSNSSIH